MLPVTDRASEYADQVAADLDAKGFRVEVDHRNEKIGKKIREATLEKIPYMLVLRLRTGEDKGAMSLADFEAVISEDVRTKAIW